MRRLSFICLILLTAAACSQSGHSSRSVHGMVLLTREGCTHAIVMRAHLEEALHAVGLQADYQFVDVATLGATDPRSIYPVPTLLYKDRDLFGMSAATLASHLPT